MIDEEQKHQELIKPELGISDLMNFLIDKEQINIIRSIIRGVEEFSQLSNFARMDIAQLLKAREVRKGEILLDKRHESYVNFYILIEGSIKLIQSDSKFKEYLRENEISSFTELSLGDQTTKYVNSG